MSDWLYTTSGAMTYSGSGFVAASFQFLSTFYTTSGAVTYSGSGFVTRSFDVFSTFYTTSGALTYSGSATATVATSDSSIIAVSSPAIATPTLRTFGPSGSYTPLYPKRRMRVSTPSALSDVQSATLTLSNFEVPVYRWLGPPPIPPPVHIPLPPRRYSFVASDAGMMFSDVVADVFFYSAPEVDDIGLQSINSSALTAPIDEDKLAEKVRKTLMRRFEEMYLLEWI